MADPHAKMAKATTREVLVSVALGLVAPLIAIVLILFLINSIQREQVDVDSPEAAERAVLKNIAPVAKLEALDANAPKVEKSGEEVFNEVCTSCHTPGALGAPKLNSKGDWAGRLGQGFDKLTANAINGIRAMPPRGGNPDLSDLEIARTVAYMANSAGAKFKAPEPAAAAPATAAAAAPAANGKTVYEASCALCHGAGVAGAPKFGDKAAWSARIAQGNDTLYKHAMGGFTGKSGMMPAKGGNPSLPDADVKAAVDYMVSQAK